MWTEFEWGNRVSVSTTGSYIHLNCLDAPQTHRFVFQWSSRTSQAYRESDFLSANVMFAVCSVSIILIFLLMVHFSGKDALARLSVEKTEAGSFTGHVRICSESQGIALSSGHITMWVSFTHEYDTYWRCNGDGYSTKELHFNQKCWWIPISSSWSSRITSHSK